MAKNSEKSESLAFNKKHTFKNSKVVESLKETFSNDGRIGKKVIKLLQKDLRGERAAIDYIIKEEKNNKKMALYLINAGMENFVGENLRIFKGLDLEIASSMIERGYRKDVLDNARMFEGVDHNLIVNKVIDTVNLDVESNLVSLIRHLRGNCWGLKREIADKLFSKTPFESPWRTELIGVLGSFDINSVNPQLAYNLFTWPPYLNSSVEPYNFYKNLDKFYGLDYDKLVCMGIATHREDVIKSNLEYFNKGLSQETLDKLK